jgi:glycosyltransferase involved in cell wall biosynthesis
MKKLFFSALAFFFRVIPVRWARRFCHTSQDTSATNSSAVQQMLVDVSVIYRSDARTGIQRVVRAILLQLMENPPKGYSVRPVYATRQFDYRYAEVNFLSSTQEASNHPGKVIDASFGDIFLGLDLAAHLLPRHQTQLLEWKIRGVALHVLVYDLLPLQNPQWFSPNTHRNFEHWIRWLAIYADSAICISAAVKHQLAVVLKARHHLPTDALPLRTITMGADIHASQPSTGLPEDHEVLVGKIRARRAILVVGTLEPRKGHEQILAAFELMWNQADAPLLIFVGKPGWKTEALQACIRSHPQIGRHLHWFDNASDEMLRLLYTESWGVLSASKAEGFGLPVIEAAVLGKPVLARDLPVFREIRLPNITYFHADSADELALAVSDWMGQPQDKFPTEAEKNAYSWREATRQLTEHLQASHKPTPQSHKLQTNRLRQQAN